MPEFPDVLYVQKFFDVFHATELDPREIHDNGKPMFIYTKAPEDLAEKAKQYDKFMAYLQSKTDSHFDWVAIFEDAVKYYHKE